MKIENKNGLRILTPESPEFFIYSVKTNEYHEIVYLGLNDSIDNYREIKKSAVMKSDSDRINELEKTIEEQNAAISNLMEQLASLADLINKK